MQEPDFIYNDNFANQGLDTLSDVDYSQRLLASGKIKLCEYRVFDRSKPIKLIDLFR